MRRLLLLLLAAGCTAEVGPLVSVEGLEVTEPLPGASVSAGYFRIDNNSNVEIVVTRITSPQFERVEIHETRLEDGISKMRRLEELRLPGKSSITLQRGGKHLMLMRPTGAAREVTINLYAGDDVLLSTTARMAER